MKIFLILLFVFIDSYVIAQRSEKENVEQVHIEVEDGKLYGTLTIADSIEKSPIVLIIAGSGPTDRNMGKGMSYRMLSDSLESYNISSLRVDKRTAGKSFENINHSADFDFDYFIEDMNLWIDYIKTDSRFSSVIVLGHSQGSLIGMLCAQGGNVDKYISLAGAGETIDLVIKKQIYDPPINKLLFGVYIDSLFCKISRSEFVETDSIPLPFQGLFNRSSQPFLLSWMKYDPVEEIKKVEVPILIVQGEMDFQVRKEQFRLLQKAKPSADTLLVMNMNHAMKFANTLDKLKNSKNYDDPSVGLETGLILGLVSFILSD